jgi:predicted transcriptional regulator of viral defense system
MSSTTSERALVDVASSQGGYFSAKQASRLGYTAPKRTYHVRVGNWIRERPGIFRVVSYPLPERPDLIVWWLWSRDRSEKPQGVYSHQTAISLHGLTDLMPSRLHMTVPLGFRRSAASSKGLNLHLADVPDHDRELIDGVPVTNALRTLLDLVNAGDVPVGDLRAAYRDAVKSGKITRVQIAAAEKSAQWSDVMRTLQEDPR